jgi:hypothetical protein
MHTYAYTYTISTIRTKNRIPGYSLYIHDRTKHNYTIYTETKNRTKNRPTPSKNKTRYWTKNKQVLA